MDPITVYRLGQIRQQELLESFQRDQEGYEVEGAIASPWQRLRIFVSDTISRSERPQAHQQTASVECGESFAPSH